jgi:6-phosphofructokinase 2
VLDILTVTLNPTIDLTTSVAAVVAGPKLRCAVPEIDPGGGGTNVSRAIGFLGGTSRAMVAVGGGTGERLLTLLNTQGIATVALPAPGETRQSLAVADRSTGEQFRFVLPGPEWRPADVAQALASIAGAAGTGGGLVVLSGSQPPGVPEDFPARLAARLQGRARLIVDTSGAPLRALARGGGAAPWCLRMDDEEAADLAGYPLDTVAESAAYAEELVTRGVAEVVILARGADGAVLASAGGRIHARSAKVEVVSKVGAGDSFVGAFTLAVARGEGLEMALRMGNAAAAAAVMTEATRLCRAEDVARLLPECPAQAV